MIIVKLARFREAWFSTRALIGRFGCCAKIPREAFSVFSSITLARPATSFAVSRACADDIYRDFKLACCSGVFLSSRADWPPVVQ